MISQTLSRLLRDKLLTMDGVRKLGPVRRASTIYSGQSISDSIFFVDSGYVKIVKKGQDGKEVIISIVSPGQIFGEQAAFLGGARSSSAEVLQDGIFYEIPRNIFLEFCRLHPESWQLFTELLVERERELEHKIGLLCLHDVETRILYYLNALAPSFGLNTTDGAEYCLPLSQSELASLIGATRETTSTTLNLLARRGLIRLGRRQLIINSGQAVANAVKERAVGAA